MAAYGASAGAQSATDVMRVVSTVAGTQGRLLWIDGTANLTRTIHEGGTTRVIDYTTTQAGVAEVVRHCKAAHINTLVVDVKPLSGEVLYASKVAPRLRQWKGRPVPDFDVLAAFIAEGHKAGLLVDADINILSEGHKFFSTGPAYTHPDWQSVVYTLDRGLMAPSGARLPIRVPGEPSEAGRPTLLAENSGVLGGEPTASIGLDTTGTDLHARGGESAQPIGRQLNVVIGADNRVTGVVDSGLLGDDLLSPPDDGRLVTATRPSDRAWVGQNLKPGTPVSFDMRTALTPIAEAPSEKVACFVNPLNPDARRHELDIVRELVQNYDIDGLVLDRCRYSDLYNDFSDTSRQAFARFLGHPVNRWPQDAFAFPTVPGGDVIEGPYYRDWLRFRAGVIRDFVGEVARTARSLKPGIKLGTYVGSWYPAYYEVGVNWGSAFTSLRYSWFTPDYPRTGYAEFFDWISTGCYYPVASKAEAIEQGRSERATVEYAADLSRTAVAGGTFIYPGLYLADYTGKPEAFLKALEVAGRQAQGWMIFDLSWINDFGWWPRLEALPLHDAHPPESMANLLSTLRSARDAAE
jgi:uncharacterized lipoprotein YddW (UPF0748 family)